MQLSFLGQDRFIEDDTKFVERLLAKFPAAASDTGLFFYLCAKERVQGLVQLPENVQLELKAYFRDLESLRRRRQECRQRDEEAKGQSF